MIDSLLSLTQLAPYCRSAEDPFDEYPGAKILIYIIAGLLFGATALCFIKVCVITLPSKYLLKCQMERKATTDFDNLSLHHALHGPSAPPPPPGWRPYQMPLKQKQFQAHHTLP